jgi:hypothetical protein
MHDRALTCTVRHRMSSLMGGTKVPIDLHIHIALRVNVAGIDNVTHAVARAVEHGSHHQHLNEFLKGIER